MKSFRELRVWQAGMELVEEVKQLYALRNSLARAPSRPIPVT
jgi:hypothetical protein